MSTDDEQDLLRAMLVMAASGLDSMLKQLIRDTLSTLVAVNDRVRDGLEKFATRSIRGEAEVPDSLGGTKFLARVLISSQPQQQVIEEYIRELTGGSLQSVSELSRTAAALGLSRTKIDHSVLNPIFGIRNKIIHELDIDLDGDRRKRNLRGRDAMMKATNKLLEVGEEILGEVDGVLGVP